MMKALNKLNKFSGDEDAKRALKTILRHGFRMCRIDVWKPVLGKKTVHVGESLDVAGDEIRKYLINII